MTHYDTLGVPEDADAAMIRRAYHRLARRHHPDHGADPAAMAAINEAHRVLADPGRRAEYDLARRGGRVTVSTGGPPAGRPSTPAPIVDRTPAAYPWRLVLGMGALGATVVLVGAALYEPRADPPPDNLLVPGSCVEIETNGDAREVTCRETANELVVRALVPAGETCPDGTAAHRDRQGRGLACVEPRGE
jgi:hypothetical protein